MNPTTVQRVLGILLMLFSFTLVPPMLVSLLYGDEALGAFVTAFAITLVTGLVSWLPVHKVRRELRLRDGFLVVVMFWTVLSAIGALPFILAEHPHLSVVDAVFESVSGLTTTGASVISGLDTLPRSIVYYRQQLQWLGGMGIIVLAVAVLPMLGIGGMQLYRAETPGPMKDSKLTPRITETAKALWYIYLGITIACVLSYWLAGMDLFDAVGHAYATVAIGGFSTHDKSFGYYDSQLVYYVADFFIFVSVVNFALHFVALRHRDFSSYWHDQELRFYVAMTLMVVGLTVAGLYLSGTFPTFHESVAHGLFQVMSIGSTTGFTTDNFYEWPGFLTILLLFTSFVGGCAGSTGGGIKVIRVLLLVKQGMREITRLVHPNAQIPVRVGDKTISPRVVEAVWGFFALYVASFTAMYLLLAATGLDLMTAFSAVGTTINNGGGGLAGATYAELHDAAKWILCFSMLLGRLEIFTLLVLLTPTFWRR